MKNSFKWFCMLVILFVITVIGCNNNIIEKEVDKEINNGKSLVVYDVPDNVYQNIKDSFNIEKGGSWLGLFPIGTTPIDAHINWQIKLLQAQEIYLIFQRLDPLVVHIQ